ncbi:hypothetical protein LWC34_04630 [Kibdelosporangium philippinense]|uniref:Uncharacterized protein n=1 Tax=Kibdelosporangium philippinense TaxID=211113 RepID=A0ABS8Z2G2_9PSEU|nr:hypothetical protein [Kibdelosporangium philippinense]
MTEDLLAGSSIGVEDLLAGSSIGTVAGPHLHSHLGKWVYRFRQAGAV